MRYGIRTIARLWLSMGGIGFVPLMPGTAGSAAALALFMLLDRVLPSSLLLRAIILGGIGLAIFALSLAAIPQAISTAHYDARFIVIDEALGMLVACSTLLVFQTLTPTSGILALLLFRLFDIAKPLGIRRIDRMNAPAAVLLDDVLAGIYALLGLAVLMPFIIAGMA